MSPAPQSFPNEPTPVTSSFLKTYGCTILAASAFPIALVCVVLWIGQNNRIPTGEDADNAFRFRAALVEALQPYRIKDFDSNLRISPQRGGRGILFLGNRDSYSNEEFEIIRREYERLNIKGNYRLD